MLITVMQAGAELFEAIWENREVHRELLIRTGLAREGEDGALELTFYGKRLLENVRRVV